MAFHMSDSSRKFLQQCFPEFFRYADLDEALLALDAFITREGLDSKDDMTDFGYEAQNVYDDIFFNND